MLPRNDTFTSSPDFDEDGRVRALTSDFALAAVRRALRKNLDRAAVLLAVTPRFGGGYDYQIIPLAFRPSVLTIVHFLDELPLGTLVAAYSSGRVPRAPLPPRRYPPRLRAV